jgi:hypothetical protein
LVAFQLLCLSRIQGPNCLPAVPSLCCSNFIIIEEELAVEVLRLKPADQKIATPFGGLATPPGTYKNYMISLRKRTEVMETHLEWHARKEE